MDSKYRLSWRLGRALRLGVAALVISCSDSEMPGDSPQIFPDVHLGEYHDRCDAEGEFEVWDTESIPYTMTSQHIEGCGVYRTTMSFDHVNWRASLEICNRCSTERFVTWPRYPFLDFDKDGASDWGDGLSGIVRFEDESGRFAVNQCDVEPRNGGEEYWTTSPEDYVVETQQLLPGQRFKSKVRYPKERFVQDYTLQVLSPAEWEYAQNPVNFGALERSELVLPRLTTTTERSLALPYALCREFGIDATLFEISGIEFLDPAIISMDSTEFELLTREIHIDLPEEYWGTLTSETHGGRPPVLDHE